MPIGKLERGKIQGGRVPGGGLVAYIFPKCCTTKCGATAVRQPESRQLQPASGYCVSDVPPIGIGDKHYWAFYNASDGEYVIGQGGGTAEQHANCVDIEWGEVQPGDLLFYPEDERVGIAAGRDWLGRLLVVHCASGTGGVAISHRTGFETAARPVWYGEE